MLILARSLDDLDVTLPPLSPSPPPEPEPELEPTLAVQTDEEKLTADLEALTKEIIVAAQPAAEPEQAPPDVEMHDATLPFPPSTEALSTTAVAPAIPTATTTAESSPEASHTPQLHHSPAPPEESSLTSAAQAAWPTPTASTSAVPYASAATATPSLVAPVPSPAPTHASLPAADDQMPFFITEIHPRYVERLPDLPQEICRSRLTSSTSRRKGKEKAVGPSGGPDLYKMHVKAVHTGAKNFLGRGKRVHNVLSTHDWSVRSLLFDCRCSGADDLFDRLRWRKYGH